MRASARATPRRGIRGRARRKSEKVSKTNQPCGCISRRGAASSCGSRPSGPGWSYRAAASISATVCPAAPSWGAEACTPRDAECKGRGGGETNLLLRGFSLTKTRQFHVRARFNVNCADSELSPDRARTAPAGMRRNRDGMLPGSPGSSGSPGYMHPAGGSPSKASVDESPLVRPGSIIHPIPERARNCASPFEAHAAPT